MVLELWNLYCSCMFMFDHVSGLLTSLCLSLQQALVDFHSGMLRPLSGHSVFHDVPQGSWKGHLSRKVRYSMVQSSQQRSKPDALRLVSWANAILWMMQWTWNAIESKWSYNILCVCVDALPWTQTLTSLAEKTIWDPKNRSKERPKARNTPSQSLISLCLRYPFSRTATTWLVSVGILFEMSGIRLIKQHGKELCNLLFTCREELDIIRCSPPELGAALTTLRVLWCRGSEEISA